MLDVFKCTAFKQQHNYWFYFVLRFSEIPLKNQICSSSLFTLSTGCLSCPFHHALSHQYGSWVKSFQSQRMIIPHNGCIRFVPALNQQWEMRKGFLLHKVYSESTVVLAPSQEVSSCHDHRDLTRHSSCDVTHETSQ